MSAEWVIHHFMGVVGGVFRRSEIGDPVPESAASEGGTAKRRWRLFGRIEKPWKCAEDEDDLAVDNVNGPKWA